MSLSRQLSLIVSILFTLAFCGIYVMSVENMRSYLASQLESHAQDTATSLSLSLQPHFPDDLARMETMVNAIFDGGYYRRIEVVSISGEVLIHRENSMRMEGVPSWFVDLILITAPERTALISRGWRPGGSVTVESHPGYAYRELWRDAVDILRLFGVTLLVAIALLTVTIRFLLKPLRHIEGMANAITDGGRFLTLDIVPWTRELRSVVVAINKMSRKVEEMIRDSTALADRMQKEAFVDTLTGFDNRRRFDAQLSYITSHPDEIAFGALIMIRIEEFAAYNQAHGYVEGDRLLKAVSAMIARRAEQVEGATLARIAGAEFAMLVPNLLLESARELAQSLEDGLKEIRLVDGGIINGHVGVGHFQTGLTPGQLISQADMALQRAVQKGPNRWHLFDVGAADQMTLKGAQEWKNTIEEVLSHRGIAFLFQPVRLTRGNTLLHYEALARIAAEDGALMPAAHFMPMVERHKMTSAFDRLLVEKLIEQIDRDGERVVNYSINLFTQAIHDPDFIAWLCALLERRRDVAGRLCFEIAEQGALEDLNAFMRVAEAMRKRGAQCALDNFGSVSHSFGYLQELMVDYIKIDGSYAGNLEGRKDNQFFIESITGIAHGLDMLTVAKSVEDEATLLRLAELGVVGAQGYHVGRPQTEPDPA